MKKLLFFTFLSFNSFIFCQNLSLSQLVELRKKDLGNAEEFLTAKGWEFLDGDDAGLEKMGRITFTYNKSEMSSRAESFLDFYSGKYSNRVHIQVNKKVKYNEYINSIKGYGCKLISSNIEDGNLVKIYRGATTTFEVSSGTSNNFYNEETAIWNITIFSNEDYELNFEHYQINEDYAEEA